MSTFTQKLEIFVERTQMRCAISPKTLDFLAKILRTEEKHIEKEVFYREELTTITGKKPVLLGLDT